MSEKRYIISDASKQVEVEAHVLRYWEDELGLEIPRNEMGHRYYTDKNIQLLKTIKYLKEQGFQLKAIKLVLPELLDADDDNGKLDAILKRKDELNSKILEEEHLINHTSTAILSVQEVDSVQKPTDISLPPHNNTEKMQQFQMILSDIISKAVQQNNNDLEKQLQEHITESLLKQVDALMRTREEREESRFKKLDETIRAVQKERMETAVTNEFVSHEKNVKKKGFFHRKKRRT